MPNTNDTNNEPVLTGELTAEAIANMSDEDFEKQSSMIEQQLIVADNSINQSIGSEPVTQQTIEPNNETGNQSITGLTEVNQNLNNNANPTSTSSATEDNSNVSTDNGSAEGNNDIIENNTTMSAEEFQKFLTSPFRANNVEVVVDNPEDIRKFVQMGMNYNKKMEKIRPHLAILQSLDQNQLLDKDKLSFAIDLMQHKPEAIAKLLKDSEINSYDLPNPDELEYATPNHIISNEQAVFRDKLADVNESSEGREVISMINAWDNASFAEVVQNPLILDNLVKYKQNGLHDDVLAILAKEKALGNVPPSVNDIQAYDHIATTLLEKQGAKYNTNVPVQSASQAPSNVAGSNRNQVNQTVVGNNLQTTQQVNHGNSSAKMSASIPSGASTGTNTGARSAFDLQNILEMTEEDLSQFSNFDDFIRKNNIQFNN